MRNTSDDRDESLRYPMGRLAVVPAPTPADRARWIDEIEALPRRFRAAVADLADQQLDTPYRPDGWTVRQVVHHVPDSHANAYVRLCLVLTEHEPTIRPYDQDAWAARAYCRTAPVEPSLALLAGIHGRWCAMMRELAADDWRRTWIHPESGRHSLDYLLQMYAWHSRHHLAHVTSLRERAGW